MKAISTACTGRTQSLPTERSCIPVTNDHPAGAESLARIPEMRAANGVEHGVHALARETVNLRDVVLIPVIDCDSAQLGNGRRSSRRTSTVHLQFGKAPEL